MQCRVLEVSVAGYHAHRVRRASDAQRRHLSDEALLVHIQAVHAQTRSAYGWPRVWRELVAPSVPVGKQRVTLPLECVSHNRDHELACLG